MDNYKKRRYTVSKYQENPKVKCMDLIFTDSNIPYSSTYVSDDLNGQVFQTIPLNSNVSMQNSACVQQQDPLFISTDNYQCQRIGNKIALCSLELKFCLESHNDLPYIQASRLVIVYDRNSNGAYPQYSDVFSNLAQNGILYNARPEDQFNPNNTDRFLVVYDKLWALPTVGDGFNGPTNPGSFVIDEKIELGCLETVYGGNIKNASFALQMSNILTGGLILISNTYITPTEEAFALGGTIRLWFKDC